MKITDLNFTYPVLSDSNNDYLNSNYSVIYTSTISESSRAIKIDINLSNSDLEELIYKKLATLIVHVECPITSYREVIEIEGYSTIIPMNNGNFMSTVEINTFIITSEYLKTISLNSVNSAIFGENYTLEHLEKGTILASDVTQIIDITLDINNIFKEVSSIIKVGPNKDSDYMEVDYEQNFILIKLPEKQFIAYKDLSGSEVAPLILTSTILPVLVNIISIMKNFNDEELEWFKVIEKKINDQNYRLDDIDNSVSSLVLAQNILRYPIANSLCNDILGGDYIE